MFDFNLSYKEENIATKDKTGNSQKTIFILNTKNRENSLFEMKGQEPDGDSREWTMRRNVK